MNADLALPHLAVSLASPISAVDALNRTCFCFSLDQEAMARALDSELGQPLRYFSRASPDPCSMNMFMVVRQLPTPIGLFVSLAQVRGNAYGNRDQNRV